MKNIENFPRMKHFGEHAMQKYTAAAQKLKLTSRISVRTEGPEYPSEVKG